MSEKIYLSDGEGAYSIIITNRGTITQKLNYMRKKHIPHPLIA